MARQYVVTDLSDVFASGDEKLIALKSVYAVAEEAPADPATATGFAYRLTGAGPNYPDGATRGIMLASEGGTLVLVCNVGVYEYDNGAWESVSSGGGGIDPGALAEINAAIDALESEQMLQENDITTLQEQNATRIQEIDALESNDGIQDTEIANIETEQTTQNQRLSALEHSTPGGASDSPAVADFNSGLEEAHTAGDVVRTAPYTSNLED